jgi:CRP-like cAMP-binding protein
MTASITEQSSLFSLLDEQEQRALAEHLRPCRLSDGEYVFHAGDAAAALYQVRSGKVQVELDTYEGERLVVDELQPGEVFGEISFSTAGHEPLLPWRWETPSCCNVLAKRSWSS